MALIFLLSIPAGYLLAGWCFSPAPEDPSVIAAEGTWINVLLLGIDARPGENTGRTDSIVLASLEPETGQVKLLSIPRDTRVNIPGHGWNKINSANVYGGPGLAMHQVSELLGTPINYYALVDFNSFRDTIDILGGVTVDVEQDMYLADDEYSSLQINLKKGTQRLNGEQALQYVRFRSYPRGDVDRTLHQQKFLTALLQETLRLGTLPKLPSLLPEILGHVKTNLDAGAIYELASGLSRIKDFDVSTQTLPGCSVNINGGSYWVVDPNKSLLVIASLRQGETLEVFDKTPVDPRLVGATSYTTAKAESTEKEEEIPPPEGETTPNSKSEQKTADNNAAPGDKQKPAVAIKPTDSSSSLNPGKQDGSVKDEIGSDSEDADGTDRGGTDSKNSQDEKSDNDTE